MAIDATPQIKRRRRIDSLTDAERATFGPYAQEWIRRGWATGPMTEEEWQGVESSIRACYRHAGLAEPKVIVRVPSPFVGALAAPIAAYLIGRRKHDAVGGAVGGAVHDAVDGAVRGAVDGAVGGAVHDAVDDAVHDAVGGAVGGAVHGAVDGAVHDAVGGAVDDAVHDAVGGAVGGAVKQAISRGWYRRLGGQSWLGWMAWRMWFRDHGGLELDGDLWDRAQAYAGANSAGYWWAWPDFAMVADRPTQLHVEQVAPTGWGSHRLHCETGPAIAWSDGTAAHAWHGTRVPAGLIETGWSADRILQEPNTEIRRCAIERIGWDRYIAEAELSLVDTKPDPANAPHVVRLYDVPRRIYGEHVRVVLMTNGSPDRNGELRVYGETVPADVNDAVAAVAWQYGIDAGTYSRLQRRT
jgi:hypothetical protein